MLIELTDEEIAYLLYVLECDIDTTRQLETAALCEGDDDAAQIAKGILEINASLARKIAENM